MSVISPLSLPGLQSSSPLKGGRHASPNARQPVAYRTPTKKKERNTFPTTPRSVEKQKKMLGARLKRLMENHLRLTATNKMLKGTNKTLLDQAVVSGDLTLFALWFSFQVFVGSIGES